MKNIIALLFCCISFTTVAQVNLQYDIPPIQGNFSKIQLDGDATNLQTVTWQVTGGQIVNAADLSCAEDPTEAISNCTTNNITAPIVVEWDCDLSNVPSLNAIITNNSNTNSVLTIEGQSYSTPTIVMEQAANCVGETSIFSIDLLSDNYDHDYVWNVTGDAAYKTDIKTDVSDGKSKAYITWGSNGIAEVSVSVPIGSSCSVDAYYNDILIKTPPNPPFISGLTQVCSNGTVTFTVMPQPGIVEYEWILPLYAKNTIDASTRITTTTPSLTVLFGEEFREGEVKVIVRNACGADASNTKMVYNGNPQSKIPIEGKNIIVGEAVRSYSFTVPDANWYEWHIGGPDSSLATITSDPNQAKIYVHFQSPADTNAHFIHLEARAYQQQGGCPITSATQQLRIEQCDVVSNPTQFRKFNHNDLVSSLDNNDHLVGGIFLRHCDCTYADASKLNIVTELDIRCISEEGDKDYMFGDEDDFNVTLNGNLLLVAPGANTNSPPVVLATIPVSFNVSPQSPHQAFVVQVNGNNYNNLAVETPKVATLQITSYCLNSATQSTCEDKINQDTESTFLAMIDDCIQLRMAADYDYRTDVKLETVVLDPVMLTTNTNGEEVEATFSWKLSNPNCPVNNYEFQLLKLFPANIAGDYNETKYLTKDVDWSKALTIETQSAHTSLKLTLTEGNGFYFWRVRPIGNVADNGAGNDENWGVWSNQLDLWSVIENNQSNSLYYVNLTSSPVMVQITNSGSIATNACFYTDQFDNNKNWIYSRTFAEGNTDRNEQTRIGEQITYANGLLQTIQTQSQLNQTPGSPASVSQKLGATNETTLLTDKDIIVGSQTVYDFSGRPALQSIAAPIAVGANVTLGYSGGLLNNDSNGSYTAQNFDTGTGNPSTANGIIKTYYDGTNDPQIPSTQGLPFSRTLFYNDGTSRVKEQGGVGTTFQIGGEHTAKTTYAAASDDELIRLFGDEAPSYKSVYKVTQTDPNGVQSIAYMDLNGNTIATCLAGQDVNEEGSLLPINDQADESTDEPTPFTVNQSITDNTSGQNNNIVASTTITLTEALTEVSLAYKIELNKFQNECTQWCATCQYKLKIVVINTATGESIYSEYVTIDSPQDQCNVTVPATIIPNISPPTVSLQPGTYTIIKYLEPIGGDLNTPPGVITTTETIDVLANSLSAEVVTKIKNKVLGNTSQLPLTDFPLEFINNLVTTGTNSGDVTVQDIINFLEDVESGNIDVSDNSLNDNILDSDESIHLFYQMLDVFANSNPNNDILSTQVPNVAAFGDLGNVSITYSNNNGTITISNLPSNYTVITNNVVTLQTNSTYSINNANSITKPIYIYYSPNGTIKGTIIIQPATKEYTIKYTNSNNCFDLKIPNLTCPPSPCNIIGGWQSSSTNPYLLNDNPFFADFVAYWSEHICDFSGNLSPTQQQVKENISSLLVQLSSPASNPNATIGFPNPFHYSNNISISTKVAELNSILSDLVDRIAADDYSCEEIWNCWHGGVVSYADQYSAMLAIETNTGGGVGIDDIIGNNNPPNGSGITEEEWTSLEELGGTNTDPNGNGVISETDLNSLNTQLGTPSISVNFDFIANYFDCIGYYPSMASNSNTADANDIVNTLYVTPTSVQNEIRQMLSCIQAAYITYFPNNIADIHDKIEQHYNDANVNYVITSLTITNLPTDNTTGQLYQLNGMAFAQVMAEIRNNFYECYSQLQPGATVNTGGFANISINAPYAIDCSYTDNNGSQNTISALAGQEITLENYMLAMQNCPVDNLPDDNCLYTFQYIRDVLNNNNFSPDHNSNNTSPCTVLPLPARTECLTDRYTQFLLEKCQTYAPSTPPNYNDLGYYIQNLSSYQISMQAAVPEESGSFRCRDIDQLAGQGLFAPNDVQNGYFMVTDNGCCPPSTTVSTTPPNLIIESINNAQYDNANDCHSCTVAHQCLIFTKIPQGPAPNPYTCDNLAATDILQTLYSQIQQNATQQAAVLTQSYQTQCTLPSNIHDELTVSYTLKQHQYTLYYYDRAGNLIKTVPPEGVAPLAALTNTNVKNRQVSPQHSLVTDYQYNSLGQVVRQHTPDGGTTKFWRNLAGQVRFSQNEKQLGNSKYSYTKYDKLGRVMEVGEVSANGVTGIGLNPNTYLAIPGSAINNTYDPLAATDNCPPTSGRSQIVKTFYSTPCTDISLPPGRQQRFLQNRVSYTYFAADQSLILTNTPTNIAQRHYTIYSYDVHGNVEWLCQYIPVKNAGTAGAPLFQPRFIDYQYDLISGKVLQVVYNKGQIDQFAHRYTYDAQNRLVYTETSNDLVLWDKDASYSYYPHGPLRRTEVGDDKIQGIDYTYTAQGWLKAINAPILSEEASNNPKDPYQDGILDNTKRASMFPPDLYGMQLHYFDGDFVAPVSPITTLNNASSDIQSLYNGNIAAWTERGIKPPNTNIELDQTLQYRYQYDLLNRIKKSNTYSVATSVTVLNSQAYNTTYSFDRNGNVTLLSRNNESGGAIDNFSYTYSAPTIGDENRNNRLGSLTDDLGTGTTDFKGTTAYAYDLIGNVTDEVNSIMGNTHMEWTPYGKISQVTHPGGNPNNLPNLTFAYDATQNRVRQDETYTNSPDIYKSSLYVRDAQGNPMAIYEQTGDNSLQLKEMPLYGSSRLGNVSLNMDIPNTIGGSGLTGQLTFPTEQKYNSEYNHLLFGMFESPFELLATVEQPNPVLFNYPAIGSISTGNNQNTSVAENEEGIMTIGQTVNTNNSNSLTCYNTNQVAQIFTGTATSEYSNFSPKSQSITVPIINNFGEMSEQYNCYLQFSVNNDHNLMVCKMCYDTPSQPNQLNFKWRKILTNSEFEKSFALSADYTSQYGKITLYLRKKNTAPTPPITLVKLTLSNITENIGATYSNTNIVLSTVGTAFDSYIATNTNTPEIQISPNGQQLAVANNIGTSDAGAVGQLRLYQIDPTTQTPTLSTTVNATIVVPNAQPKNYLIRSIDFSPEGKYVYAIVKRQSTEQIARFNLSTNPISFEIVSQSTNPDTYQTNQGASYSYSTIRRAKNQRMYVAFMLKTKVLSILNPDENTISFATHTLPLYGSFDNSPYKSLRGNINAQAHIKYNVGNKRDYSSILATQERGQKQYELTDHLGNVRTTFSDIKQAKATDTP
ncbi:MAG: hypothetical protein JNM36_19025, partial [Chitinophagales bacterium]|nr:hypothetical protein [Chitinophagales bacterium]